eukprot:11236518-Ditylum_brightwellii.AAC.3
MFAKSLADFFEEVPRRTRDFLFKLTFPPHIGFLFCNLLLEMCHKKTPLLEYRAFLNKEVSILNLLPPDLLLDETTVQVPVEKRVTIEDIVDMPTAKRSKISTTMNTIGLCKTKENILETIADWLLFFKPNFVVDASAPPLLYGAFFMLVDLIISQDYKNWYDWCIKKAPWVPIQHLEQIQQMFAGMSKFANTPALIRKVMAERLLDPAPFVHLYNAASDLARDIEVCTQLGSLGQIFAKPSSLYVTPAVAPGILPARCPMIGAMENKESENQRKKKQAQKKG